mgnify:CR=1 FL=1
MFLYLEHMDETPSSLSIRGRLIYTLSNSKHVFTHSTPFGQTGHMLRNDVWTLFYFHYMSKKYSISKEKVKPKKSITLFSMKRELAWTRKNSWQTENRNRSSYVFCRIRRYRWKIQIKYFYSISTYFVDKVFIDPVITIIKARSICLLVQAIVTSR